MYRRRAATREELIELLAGREPEVDWSRALDALTLVGVRLEHEVTVTEEVDWDAGYPDPHDVVPVDPHPVP